jgi:hypothetical protein
MRPAAQFDTESVPAIAHGRGAGRGQGAAHAPEPKSCVAMPLRGHLQILACHRFLSLNLFLKTPGA